MAKPLDPVRRAALVLMSEVTEEGRMLADVLPKVLRDLASAERARAQRLAVTAFQWMDRADRMLGPYLRQRPPDAALNALRLGVVEMAVDRAAPHGVIDALVSLVKVNPDVTRMSGMVNAVLRRVSEDLGKWEGLPVPRLPKKMRKSVVAAYGKLAVEAIELAHSRGAPLDITPRDGLLDLSIFGKMKPGVLPNGSVRLADPGQVSALPGFEAGLWWVQDAAASLPVSVLAPLPGERVLDMCAAPGGKTMQMAAAGAEVVALDISQVRMRRVAENLERTGLRARMVVADAFDFDEAGFDAILLDAPCSASGTVRRHPDLPYAKAGRDLGDLLEVQARMIDHALALLKPGGRLVFCTCSLWPEEGEAQIDGAMARHPGLVPQAIDVPGIDPAWHVAQGVRTRPDYWPDLGGLDGFFIGSLRKDA